MKKLFISSALALAFIFALVLFAQAKNPHNQQPDISKTPTWQITQDGTDTPIEWVDHPDNPRFAVYDPDTPSDVTDDIVFDKETCLIWERSPSARGNWYDVSLAAYGKSFVGRMGCRLPEVEELATLVDTSEGQQPTLPPGHPFANVNASAYWTATPRPVGLGVEEDYPMWCVRFQDGRVASLSKTGTSNGWFVRGGT